MVTRTLRHAEPWRFVVFIRKGKQTMFTISGVHQYPINLIKCVQGYAVTYGAQVKTDLNAEEAYNELANCLRHAMACDGIFDELDKESDHE
jgi:hypothetical protein